MNFTYTVHYQICDDILKNIAADDDMHEVEIERFLGEDRRAKLAIVRQLDNDGYIRRVNAQTSPFSISITVKGNQFNLDGGYKKYFNEARQKHLLETSLLETNISTNKSVKKSNLIQIVISALVSVFVIISTFYQAKTFNLEAGNKNLLEEIKKQYKTDITELKTKLQTLENNFLLDSTNSDSTTGEKFTPTHQ